MSDIIAILPGDGIGPEVTHAAAEVLKAVRPDLDCRETLVGGAALERGLPALSPDALALCRRSAS